MNKGENPENLPDEEKYPERYAMCDGGSIYESHDVGGCEAEKCCGLYCETCKGCHKPELSQAAQDYVQEWHNKPYYTGHYIPEAIRRKIADELKADGIDFEGVTEEEFDYVYGNGEPVIVTHTYTSGNTDTEHVRWETVKSRLSEERRVTDPNTGGQKGEKPEEYAYIPPRPLAEVARVYGSGAEKYEPWNWTKGYEWRLSFSALGRHIEDFRAGESINPDSGHHHLAHAAFHLFTLMEFDRLGLGTDDRWTK